jgi:hypothetical protein
MKRFFAAICCVGIFAGSVSSASACCLWPFGGWWGAGYGAPMGGYYGASYPSYAPVTAGYYSAGYGSADCCAPACCDPCGGGGCNNGSCIGSTAPAGSLKPQTDPNFDNGTKEKDKYDDEFDRDRLKRPSDLPERDRSFTPRTRTTPEETAPIDDFRSRPTDRGTDPDPAPFGTGNDQINNKPPMAEPDDLPAVDPDNSATGTPDGSTFLDEDNGGLNNQTRRDRRELSVTERPSGLNEVIAPKRLASRSVPTTRVQNRTSFAGKADSDKNAPVRPVRWISLPMPEGNERL